MTNVKERFYVTDDKGLVSRGIKDAVPSELVSFLEYVGDPATREQTEDAFVRSLDTQISTIKRDREWRSKYMLLEIMMAKERKEGELRKVIDQCCRKLVKGRSNEEIADALECDISEINAIVDVAQKYAPDYDVDRILEELCGETQQ